jgi:hypothetical protein
MTSDMRAALEQADEGQLRDRLAQGASGDSELLGEDALGGDLLARAHALGEEQGDEGLRDGAGRVGGRSSLRRGERVRDEAHGRRAWGSAGKVVNHFWECGCTV